MSDRENFLTRWSRRKLEPAEKKATDEPKVAAEAQQPSAEPARPAPEGKPAPEFDINTLPSLDSIGASSDIRPFLQAGVPSALRHAALRRAWSADPAISDFIGLNENFWDAKGVEAAPGFGALDPSLDVKKLLAQVIGDSDAEPQATVNVTSPTEDSARVEAANELAASEPQSQSSKRVLQGNDNVASHQDDEPSREVAAIKRRRHGGAMPR